LKIGKFKIFFRKEKGLLSSYYSISLRILTKEALKKIKKMKDKRSCHENK